jgi:hypothetical protein
MFNLKGFKDAWAVRRAGKPMPKVESVDESTDAPLGIVDKVLHKVTGKLPEAAKPCGGCGRG